MFGRSIVSIAAAVPFACLVLSALYALPLLHVAANRIVVGSPVYASGVLEIGIHLAAVLSVVATGLLAWTQTRVAALAALTLAIAAFGLLVLVLASGASDLVAGRPPATRAGLATGAWLALLLLAAGIGLALRRTRVPGLGPAIFVLMFGSLVLAGRAGAFEGLSLAVEYRARRETVIEATLQHLVLSGGAVALALLCAIALSLWRRGQGIVEILVGGVQVIPAIALFGGLVALTSGLLRAVPSLREFGLSPLGPGPALVGIGAYLLLPLWRGIATALRSTEPAIIDAATAMGLTPAQVLARVRLPLGAPILIGALRVAVVQSLGLATLGALVGAGGLGQIVFDGMAQFAPDLILLGAIPIVALSLAAERALGSAEVLARRRWRA